NINVLWYHRPDSSDISETEIDPEFINNLKKFTEKGGGLFLSLDAVKLTVPLGLEKTKPEVKYAQAIDEGYGRKLGLHSFRTHPVFKGLNGGAYIWAPVTDENVRQVGYFENSIPQGKVVAVDWAYITLKEDSKLMIEYDYGKGKILSVGAYTYFAPKDQNRLQLELFVKNCLNYLSGVESNVKIRYWNYKPLKVEEFSEISASVKLDSAKVWNQNLYTEPITLSALYASDNEWDTGGERILIMGKEKGGIDEIWTHPFMAIRDYDVGVQFSYRDTIYWFNDQNPQIEINPGSFTRMYKFPRAYITEIITSDINDPTGIEHYEYRGVYPAKLIIKFKSNLRFMWPYSHKAIGSIYYTWDENLNAFVIKNETDEFYSIVGASKTPEYKLAGRFDGFSKDAKVFKGIETDKLQAACLMQINLQMNDNLDVFITGTDEGFNIASDYYKKTALSANAVYENTVKYYNDFLNNTLMITTPDENFNTGYRWALIGSERFFVNTPGIGKSLVAGYSTTAHGWDGNQEVNGRPGYAWYFGRDGEWSGMAMLDYSDFPKVKNVLETYQKYQDVNGKIFHELTTSGVVHYDAADATPLYVVLAGRYLRWTGDKEFIKSSWSHIKSAVDFLFSTDTDGDHLIENTNVGHGWVEGGELFGSKTEFYLAGSWAETLREAEYIASVLGYKKEAERYQKEFEIVQKIVNDNFWNPETNFYNCGLLPDNTYNTQKTALASVPAYFGLISPQRAYSILDAFATDGFTADWGVRIISEDNPLFNPRGYHYGSIWPLFTGWTALAEYTYGNYIQGFNHLMDNLNVYKSFAQGYVEEVLNGEQYMPSGVCPHQCWSETMVLQPILEGMLGLKADALSNQLTISPRLPADWNFMKVENIRIGNLKSGVRHLDFRMTRTSEKIVYFFNPGRTLSWQSIYVDESININFIPYLPQGTQIIKILIDGKQVNFEMKTGRQEEFVDLNINVKENSQVEIYYSGGICALPVITDPKVGEYSEGFRILSTEFNDGEYTVRVQGKSKNEETLKVYSAGQNIASVENGTLLGYDNNVYSIGIVFDSADKYQEKEIIIKLKEK
ncbi:MAG TPA: GH116 family glycosyl hydrolase, partial [Ignavibacteriaceae bacterium]|nr:GH116 family glycosyl hydrolase [Ignavibacteriaceae bacterium]